MKPIAIVRNGRADPKAAVRDVEFVRQNCQTPMEMRAQQIQRVYSALKSADAR